MARNDIFNALLAIAAPVQFQSSAGVVGFEEVRRRVVDWNGAKTPGLYQGETGEVITRVTNMPSSRTLKAEWWVYINDGNDTGFDPSNTVNNIIDALEAALEPTAGATTQTLGGLVYHAFIAGTVVKVAGDVDGAGLIIIPIEILVP